MVYAVCGGDMGKKLEIERTYTWHDVRRWLYLKQFDGAE
jgi:hypothetical protein